MRSTLPSARRLAAALGVTAAGAFIATALASPASATPGGTTAAPPSVDTTTKCVAAADARYRHTFEVKDGKATATIELAGPALCKGEEQAFSLVSYLAPSARFQLPQYVFDTKTVTLSSKVVQKKLKVDVPKCFTQVDFVFGDRVIDPLTSNDDLYGNRKVGSPAGEGARSTAKDGSKQQAWYNGGKDGCKTAPAVEANPTCDGLTLKLRNGQDSTTTKYTVVGSGGFTREVTVTRDQKVGELVVPAANAASVSVKVGKTEVGAFSWAKPEDCAPPTIVTSTDCTGATVKVTNPAGNTPVEVVVTADEGVQSSIPAGEKLVVAAGKDATVTLSGLPKFTAKVTVGGLTELVSYTRAATCTSASPSTPPGLPVTGSSSGTLAAVAGGLVALGGVLFLVARRRRVTFTS